MCKLPKRKATGCSTQSAASSIVPSQNHSAKSGLDDFEYTRLSVILYRPVHIAEALSFAMSRLARAEKGRWL